MTNSSALWAALDILNINVPGSKQWKVKSCVYWQALRITYSHSSKAKEAKQFLLQSSNSAQRQKASLAKNGSVPSAISVLLFCLSACLGSACIFGTSATSTPATATSTSDSRQQLQLQLKLPLPQTYAYPRPPPPLTGLNFWHVPALFFGSPAAGQQRFPCICIRSPAISFQIRPEQKYMALFGAMARKWAGHKLRCTIVNRFCLGALVFYFAF